MVHIPFRAAQEKCPFVDFIEFPGDKLATQMTGLPTVSSRRNNNSLKVGQSRFQAIDLALEYDVSFRAHAIEENRFGIETTVINISKDRHNRGNAAATG